MIAFTMTLILLPSKYSRYNNLSRIKLKCISEYRSSNILRFNERKSDYYASGMAYSLWRRKCMC